MVESIIQNERGIKLTDSEIIFYGNKWCPDCRRARMIFDRLTIPYQFIDVDADAEAKKRVMEINRGFCSVPTILFPDGTILTEPSNQVLEQKLAQL